MNWLYRQSTAAVEILAETCNLGGHGWLGVGSGDIEGGVEEFEGGLTLLAGMIECFGGDAGINLLAQLKTLELGIDKSLIDATDHRHTFPRG